MFGAYSDGELKGVLGFRKESHIMLLYVKKGCLRQGIGTKLVKFYLGECQEDVITVNAAPFGSGFYEAMGFHANGGMENKHGILSTPMKFEKKKESEES